MTRKTILCICLVCFSVLTFGQNVPIDKQRFIYFPYPTDRKWTTSIGVTATTMPYEITEELHYRIPAGDLHVLAKLAKKLYLDGDINFQVVQNLITLGPRFSTKLTDRLSMSLGDNAGFWFAFLNVQGFRTRGTGWQNYPNASFGYRFNKRILLTVRAEANMTFGIKTYAGENPVTTNYKLLSGSSWTVLLEQPFYGKKSLTLGLRAMYTTFYWQTWSAFTTFDRNFFYPQLIIGLIL
jgi:hypothetical protein